jgi:hypothetical protein
MKRILRNFAIGAAIAFATAFLFGFLGAVAHSPDVADTGAGLGVAIGVLAFFVLHFTGGNRKVAAADDASRQRALAFTCPPNRALVYFIRTGFAGKAVGVDIVVDGRPVAQIKSPRFTCIDLPPGTHELVARVGDGTSALNPGTATLSTPLAAGSVALLHIAIQRNMLKSQLVFEPWSVEAAGTKLAAIGMVLPETIRA